jgi:GMP synthase (glutamine-hydrolysing)
MPEQILILQHDPEGPPGTFGEWAAERGFEIALLHAERDWPLPALDPFRFLVSLGSNAASFDDSVPWLSRELRLLDRALAQDIPVFGICFGSQVLARSLGSDTRPIGTPEIGWYEVDSSDPALPRGPWMFWHEDQFDLPAEAELLASTPVGPAAFQAGQSIGVQFHPEVAAATVEAWILSVNHDLSDAAARELRFNFAVEPSSVRARAWQLFDRFLAGIS